MLSKETLQTALENVENHFAAKQAAMGDTEKARYKRCMEDLKAYIQVNDVKNFEAMLGEVSMQEVEK